MPSSCGGFARRAVAPGRRGDPAALAGGYAGTSFPGADSAAGLDACLLFRATGCFGRSL